ncbi:MAG TPA: glucosamine-6-phosphate deaminase [Verrucomicrobiales bacterium]|jgi:glucosamine-6-phosphate deaminase|nr:glucosamine-6-phosphate deaminase [Verrucomicrobiales bacterium]
MKVSIHPSPDTANIAAADLLADWLLTPDVRNVMVAAGNSPLELYGRIAERGLPLAHLEIFALDEYVGVRSGEPRNCANLLRRTVARAWGVPAEQFHGISSVEPEALASVQAHGAKIAAMGGIDVVVLGLGQNGHLGFNEPGSAPDSSERVLDLDAVSVEANRRWFAGDCAPSRGATTGLKTILAARRVLLLAFGNHKSTAVHSMIHGPRTPACPASLLQGHANVCIFLDTAAAEKLPSIAIA